MSTNDETTELSGQLHPDFTGLIQPDPEDLEGLPVPADLNEDRFGPWTGQPQFDQQPDTVAPNTEDQTQAFEENERLAAEEATWPSWRVIIQGDNAYWEARAGQNLAREDQDLELTIDDAVVHSRSYKQGEPMPWVSPAKANVELKAKNAKLAGVAALRANPGYHTVLIVEARDD